MVNLVIGNTLGHLSDAGREDEIVYSRLCVTGWVHSLADSLVMQNQPGSAGKRKSLGCFLVPWHVK